MKVQKIIGVSQFVGSHFLRHFDMTDDNVRRFDKFSGKQRI